MDDIATSLPYSADDREFHTVADLSRQARLSRAFIQLCIDAGCPLFDGRLTHAILLDWLTQNYGAVRQLAGLPSLASTEGVARRAQGELRLANTMLTLLQFAESRSSVLAEKAQLRRMQQLVERGV